MYNGNASQAPFTLDYGYLGAGPEGVLLELTAPSQTKLSSTDYVLYGNMQLTARHNARQGLVFTFITMSDTKDEIDNEQTTADGSSILTNFFSQGIAVPGSSATIPGGSGFNVADWHTYGINWQPTRLQWLIDGNVVHTITASSVGSGYPRSPSQVQISVWAGGNSTNSQGVIDWSGGPIDWTSAEYTKNGYYTAEIKQYSITCGSQSVSGVSTTGNGTSATSWVYTGKTSSTLNEPEFVLSSDPIKTLSNPSSGGTPGLPGYSSQSAFTKSHSNAWDGSGSTSGLSASEISGSSNSGGWLANNKTLSIAVPVVAVLLAIIALCGIMACCRRRRRRAQEAAGYSNTKQAVDSQFNIASKAAGPLGGDRQSAYSKLDDDEYEDDTLPYGSQKTGAGYGPATGPVPGQYNRNQHSSDGSYEMSARQQQQGYTRSPNAYSGHSPAFPPGGYSVPAYTSSPSNNQRSMPPQSQYSPYGQQQQQNLYQQQQSYPQSMQPGRQMQQGQNQHQYQQSSYAHQQSGGYRNY